MAIYRWFSYQKNVFFHGKHFWFSKAQWPHHRSLGSHLPLSAWCSQTFQPKSITWGLSIPIFGRVSWANLKNGVCHVHTFVFRQRCVMTRARTWTDTYIGTVYCVNICVCIYTFAFNCQCSPNHNSPFLPTSVMQPRSMSLVTCKLCPLFAIFRSCTGFQSLQASAATTDWSFGGNVGNSHNSYSFIGCLGLHTRVSGYALSMIYIYIYILYIHIIYICIHNHIIIDIYIYIIYIYICVCVRIYIYIHTA